MTGAPSSRHGDVDRNGDLVDELVHRIGPFAGTANRPGRETRIAGAITAATRELADEHLSNVLRVLERVAA